MRHRAEVLGAGTDRTPPSGRSSDPCYSTTGPAICSSGSSQGRLATAPWANPDQVEQDLVLSRLMVEIATHEALKTELVMRGGTCLHKLWLPRASQRSRKQRTTTARARTPT